MGGAQTSAAPAAYTAAPGGAAGDRGVFENVDDAVEAAWKAQRDWAANYKIEDRQRIIEAIRRCARAHVEEWCHKIVEETGMGRYEDKVEKHLAVINKTPGPECLTTEAKSGDAGLMLEEYAPFGVICSITPTTNPTETIINNTISMIAGGNTVVFNVHPRAKRVSADCLQALNTAIIEAGGPANLITMTREPTMENVDKMAANPKIRLMAGTGGMGMVNALLRSGKKCIGAGAGNPPVIVDETADIELAGRKIYEGASFDNNILCFAEKEVFAVNTPTTACCTSCRSRCLPAEQGPDRTAGEHRAAAQEGRRPRGEQKVGGQGCRPHSGDHRRACAGYLPPCHLRGACRPSVRSGGADDAGAAHRALPEF